jgi:Tfp pilus assembly PilM family ATPase
LVEDLQTAAKGAGLIPDRIVPGLIGCANAFELAQPEVFAKEVVALVDIGFKSSTITMLMNGELSLSRVVAIGGDRLTAGLAEAMNIGYGEAEGIKIGMPHEVQSAMEPLLATLGRELRASIDFFEHQQDKAVSQAFISGGSARSEFILQTLQAELMVQCKSWNPVSFLDLALPPKEMAEIEQAAPQLAVAVGAAVSAM